MKDLRESLLRYKELRNEGTIPDAFIEELVSMINEGWTKLTLHDIEKVEAHALEAGRKHVLRFLYTYDVQPYSSSLIWNRAIYEALEAKIRESVTPFLVDGWVNTYLIPIGANCVNIDFDKRTVNFN